MTATSEAQARKALARPTLAMLPKVSDNLSFLYADICRIVQTDTGVCAEVAAGAGSVHRVPIPTASLACLLLGPGTSITSPALATFMRHGTTVVSCGSGAILHYGGLVPESRTTLWLDRQAKAYTDDAARIAVARRMYEMRFREEVEEEVGIERLRALEGQRMKALYRNLATKHRVKPFKRNYDPASWDEQSPVNKALSAGNAALYGVVHSVIVHLGCSPAMGFVHAGKQQSFVYDIADLYKAETTIPLAFSLHDAENPEGRARTLLRTELKLYRMIPRIVRDIQVLLDPELEDEEDDDGAVPTRWRVVDLWDPVLGSVSGGVNYAGEAN